MPFLKTSYTSTEHPFPKPAILCDYSSAKAYSLTLFAVWASLGITCDMVSLLAFLFPIDTWKERV